MRSALLVVVLAGCGGSSPSRPDAPPSDSVVDPDAASVSDAPVADAPPDALPDAGIDAPPPDVLIQARITVELDGQARAGERILINRRDGSFVGEGTTDVNGIFDTMMPDGGALTWVQTDFPTPSFYTYMELHDGDVVNAGTPRPPPSAVTPISITRTQIPNAMWTNFGVDRFPDQMFTGATFSYPTTATGTATVIQDGVGMLGLSVGYSKTTVTVSPGASVTMPSTIHQANDLVVDVIAPVLQGGLITATVVPFEIEDASKSRQEAANASGAVSITFPRFVYAEVPYLSALSIYFETIGAPLYESHFTHYTIDSSVTHASFGVADLAQCPRAVVNSGATVTIGQPPTSGDFARYTLARWYVTVPHTTTSFARITVPADLVSEFAANQSPLNASTVDSGDITYREALSLQRSTHYSRYAYTGDGHPYMRECWRNQ
jgi:hypothetical protein